MLQVMRLPNYIYSTLLHYRFFMEAKLDEGTTSNNQIYLIK